MPYATAQDMLDRCGRYELTQLTDLAEPRLGDVNLTVLGRALDDASAEIDGYLIGRLALPLAAPPALLKVFCCDIARYRLMTATPDERAADAYKAAIVYLTKVAAGTVQLVPPADIPAPVGVGEVAFDGGSKVFGRDVVERTNGFWSL